MLKLLKTITFKFRLNALYYDIVVSLAKQGVIGCGLKIMYVGVQFISDRVVMVSVVYLAESRIILMTGHSTCLLRTVLMTLSVKTCLF